MVINHLLNGMILQVVGGFVATHLKNMRKSSRGSKLSKFRGENFTKHKWVATTYLNVPGS